MSTGYQDLNNGNENKLLNLSKLKTRYILRSTKTRLNKLFKVPIFNKYFFSKILTSKELESNFRITKYIAPN